MESNTHTLLPLRVIASEAKQSRHETVFLDCFVPRSDAKRRMFGLLMFGMLMALVACAPKANENTEKAQGDNLMRYARNIVVY